MKTSLLCYLVSCPRIVGSVSKYKYYGRYSRSLCVTTTENSIQTSSAFRLPDIDKLNNIQTDISNGVHRYDKSYVQNMSVEIAEILCRSSVDRETVQAAVRLLRYLCHVPQRHWFYQELGFFDTLSHVLQTVDNEDLLKTILPSYLWICSKMNYYNQAFLSRVGSFILDNLEDFNHKELNMIVQAYAHLNHHVPELISKMEKLFLSSGSDALLKPDGSFLPWTVAWAGMVFMDYPKELLAYILRDEYIKECVNFNFSILFQLNISLNKDNQDLDFGFGYSNFEEHESHFGQCRSRLKGVSDKLFLQIHLNRIRAYGTGLRSIFGSNVHRAIKTALGSPTFVQKDGLSLSGYTVDFELLFNEKGEPIRIPWEWRHRSAKLLEASLGEGRFKASRIRISEDLVDSMKEVESNSNNIARSQTLPLKMERRLSVNLASDWGARFLSFSRRPARRVVIEANGDHHYASNCDHTLGHTALKRRHIKALGWELVSINYRHWRTLENGDEQAKYIYSLLYDS